MPDSEQPTLFAPVQFSQANKLCYRASAQQAAWLAAHLAATGRTRSDVLREAIDLYIAANKPTPSQ